MPKVSGLARAVFLSCLAGVVTLQSCTYLKSSQPLVSPKEYERMLAGPLDADYIGTEKCLKGCHDHDKIAGYLQSSVHGRQKDAGSGMPLVNCETCHGPGSLAVAKAEQAKKCDTTQFVDLHKLPSGAKSLVCVKCHITHAMKRLAFWSLSQHALADVSCSDCHRLHSGPGQKLTGKAASELCFECHQEKRAEFSLFSRHPLGKGLMECTTCHDPHGSSSGLSIKGADEKSLCLGCHATRVGPYAFEHADLTSDCSTCHTPHGSLFAGMLRYQEPFLCLQCHSGHAPQRNPLGMSSAYKRAYYTRCTTCHSQIHGSDLPGKISGGGLVR
jgi:DmsE family decaheme c-type cytochrome